MRNQKGFTLIEIVVTVVAIAILMTITVPVTMSYIDDAKIKKEKNEANAVLEIANTYFNSNQSSLAGTYIESTQEQIINDQTTLNSIVTKAKVTGTINTLKYLNGEVIELEYETNNKRYIYNKTTNEFNEVR